MSSPPQNQLHFSSRCLWEEKTAIFMPMRYKKGFLAKLRMWNLANPLAVWEILKKNHEV